MVRPYLNGRRRYLLVHWDPTHQLQRGALIALVRGLPGSRGRVEGPEGVGAGGTGGPVRAGRSGQGHKARRVRPALVRYDPPWAAVVVDHNLQQAAREQLNTRWRGVQLRTVAASGTLKALWRRTAGAGGASGAGKAGGAGGRGQ